MGSAALQHKHDAHYRPHFVAQHIRTWRWLNYPWAATEDIGALIERLPEAPDSPVQLRSQLHEQHGMNVSEHRLREILLFLRPSRLSSIVNSDYSYLRAGAATAGNPPRGTPFIPAFRKPGKSSVNVKVA